jgi:hypothetical protein
MLRSEAPRVDERQDRGAVKAMSGGQMLRLFMFSLLLTMLLTTPNVTDVAPPSNDVPAPLAAVNAPLNGLAAATSAPTASTSDLMLTWKEWGEATVIEPVDGWIAAYTSIVGRSADVSSPSPPPPRGEAAQPTAQDDVAVFGLSGDIGGQNDDAGVVLAAARDDGAQWFGALGDMSYSEITPESAWCSWIRSKFPGPFEIVAGNHEDDEGADGNIARFAKCLRDRMNSTPGPGGYGVNYFFDDGPVRMIMVSANLLIDGVRYDFEPGSRERRWLVQAIRGAPGWVIVGMHKVCLTTGIKSCEIGDSLVDLLHSEGVDVVVHGHEHSYQRTHALTCSDPNTFRSGCIGDRGADGTYRRNAGTVHVIVGTAGRALYACSDGDAERRYFAVRFCAEDAPYANGFALVDVTAHRLEVAYRNVVGKKFTDRFVIE